MDTIAKIKYKITPIETPLNFNDLQKQELPYKFLYPSVKNEICVYKHKDYSQITIYSIFGFYFLVSEDTTKKYFDKFIKLEDADSYFAYYFSTMLEDEALSQTLRNSNTLKISNKNCYDNSDIKAVFSEKSFAVCNKINLNAEDKFERAMLLFLIAMSYNLKAQTLLQEVSQAYKNRSYEEMINKRDEIYSFDLNCFFSNPVKQNRQQAYDIWNVIAKVYDVKNRHDEIKTQVIDLTNVIEIKYKEKQEKIEKDKEKKLSIFLAVIAGASLISVIKDFIELIR